MNRGCFRQGLMHTYQNVCGNSAGKKRGRTILTPEGSLLDELYELPKRGKDLRRLIPDGGAAGRAQANRWKQWDAKPETKVHLCTMFVRLHRTNPPETAGHKAISRSTFLCDSLGCIWQTIGNDGTQNQRLKCLWRNARSVTGLFASEVFAKKGSLL